MLGKLAAHGDGPARIVPLAFHVDYFNRPWKDPFSNPQFSRREYQYSLIYQRDRKTNTPDELYFTPMLMIDGRFPMLGNDEAAARKALAKALAEKPAVALDLALKAGDDPRRQSLAVTVRALGPRSEGHEVLVGVAIFEEPVTTRVASGENAGRTLVEHFAVRSLVVEAVTPEHQRPATLTVPVALGEGWDVSKCGLAVFAQDENTGRILQAASVPWSGQRGR